MGDQKHAVVMRYRRACRQALINASFIKTSSFETLQAYVLFMVSQFIFCYYFSLTLLVARNKRCLPERCFLRHVGNRGPTCTQNGLPPRRHFSWSISF